MSSTATGRIGAEGRGRTLYAAAALSLLAALIHLWAMPEHFEEWWGYGTFFLVFASVFAMMVLGLNLQWGSTGLFNVGIAGFVAIGAYTSALLTTPAAAGRVGGWGWPIAAGWIGAIGCLRPRGPGCRHGGAAVAA